jgi:alanine dehydrogenase
MFIFLGKAEYQKVLRRFLSIAPSKRMFYTGAKQRWLNNICQKADVIVNAIDWYPDEPHIIKKGMLKLMKKTAVIVDISCDRGGGIETCIPTTWEEPTYSVEGITHFCVDNLPSAIPRDASIHLSEMIISHVLRVANGENYQNGLMTKNGIFEYAKRKDKMQVKDEIIVAVQSR